MSIGTGAAPKLDTEVYASGYLVTNLAGLPAALMCGAQVDQDFNCRAIGHCVYGAPIDRELEDMIPRNAAGHQIPASQDLGRAFLYARYNVELSHDGLRDMGLADINPAKVGKLDSIEHMDDLSRVGKRLAQEVCIEHFGSFLKT